MTPEHKAKLVAAAAAARAKKAEKKAAEAAAPKEVGPIAKVVSIENAPPDTVAKLLAEMADLKAQLAAEKEGRSADQQAALERAQAQGTLMQPGIEEIPTGRNVWVEKLERYKRVGFENRRPVLEPIFKSVEVPTFYYKVDMPPCGGLDIKINGVSILHGSTLECDIDTLRTVKDMVHRLWAHDAGVHGSDENAYRPKKNPELRMRS